MFVRLVQALAAPLASRELPRHDLSQLTPVDHRACACTCRLRFSRKPGLILRAPGSVCPRNSLLVLNVWFHGGFKRPCQTQRNHRFPSTTRWINKQGGREGKRGGAGPPGGWCGGAREMRAPDLLLPLGVFVQLFIKQNKTAPCEVLVTAVRDCAVRAVLWASLRCRGWPAT